MRVKRNQPITIRVPSNLGTLDNATIYFFLPELYQTIGELGKGDLNILEPEQITVSPAVKLRTLVAGQYSENGFKNDSLEEIGFTNNVMLEDLYMANYPGANLTLDLKNAVNLKTLDLRDLLVQLLQMELQLTLSNYVTLAQSHFQIYEI